MATVNDDILLDEDGDDLVRDGDWAVGDGTLDDCWIIFGLNKGTVKSDPLLGPNLQLMINAPTVPTTIKQALDLALEMDGKTPKKLDIVNGHIDFEI
jgi:hypothetical protein